MLTKDQMAKHSDTEHQQSSDVTSMRNHFVEFEHEILAFWKDCNIFEKPNTNAKLPHTGTTMGCHLQPVYHTTTLLVQPSKTLFHVILK